MLNYLRMELRRLRVQKAPLIILLSVILIFSVYSIFFNYTYHEMQDQLNEPRRVSQEETGDQGSASGVAEAPSPAAASSTSDASGAQTPTPADDDGYSMSVTYDPSLAETTGEELLLQQFSGHGFVIFLVIFAAIFFCAPYRDGFVKNFISLRKHRSPFILAEAVTGALYTLLTFLIGTATLLLFQQFYIDPAFHIADISQLFPLIGMHLLLHIAFLMVLLLLATWTRSQTAVLTAGLLWTTVLHRPILDLLTTGLRQILPFDDAFTLRDYSLVGSMARLTWGASDAEIRTSLIVALIIGTLALLSSMILIERKDIG